MAERLTFTLSGRDELSRVLNGTADSADRLRLRLAGITADADGRLRDLQGRFLTTDEALRRLADGADNTRNSVRSLSEETGRLGEALNANLISLLPAALPAAAGLASSAAAVAAQFGAVALAAGAYALALGPQMGAISEATQLQDKYEEALRTSGAGSDEASTALVAYQQKLAQLPPATREAAVAVGLLKDNYQEWSDSLSGDVMAPFIKGVAVTNALLPKTTGFVQDASGQFDRLVTLVAGGISTPGFDVLTGKVQAFSERTMREAVDNLTVFLAKLEAGQYNDSGITQFFDYAQQAGPVVMDTLENVAEALFHVLEAGSEAGMGMLDVINVLSGIVSAVPPDAIALFLQLAIAIKAVKLAAAGSAAAGAAIGSLGTQIAAARVAAAAAPGALAATGAAIGALSRTAKIAMAGTGIGLLLIGLDQLGDKGRASAPDVDKLALSLRNLADSGRFSGELAKTFGDMDGLIDKVRKLQTETDKANETAFGFRIPGLDDAADWISGKINDISKGEESLSSLRSEFDALDKGMASLVSNGYTTAAADNFQAISDAMRDAGYSTETINGLFGEYREAVAGHALENRLAAASMGIFGDQAIEVQGQLEMQKQSADGLRQAILALNDAHRSAYDAQIGFEASLDALTESFKENGATLDLNTEAGRANAQAMSGAAKANDEMLAAGLAAGESLGSMTKKSDGLRSEMLRLAEATGMTDREAREYVNTLLGTPAEVKTAVRLEREDAISGLKAVQTEIRNTPGAKSVRVDTLNAAAIKALEQVGLKTRQLPDGKTEVYTANGKALVSISAVNRALNNLDGKTAHTYTTHHVTTVRREIAAANNTGRPQQGEGGYSKYASGGTPRAGEFALVGEEGPELVIFGEAARVFDALTTRALIGAAGDGRIPAGRAISPGLPAPVAASNSSNGEAGQPSVTNHFTFNARKSVVDIEDFKLFQRQEEARQRIGRPA
ncbi:hypothetical protein AB0O67_24345 [Streptomyces sp. NPDC086077]|uniref:hypothetical protein n=1 Tax=Streptomyces sp. NPDC086077 TaxID=3154862 RepID=UPI00344A926B